MIALDGHRILVGLVFLLLAANVLKKLVHYDRSCERARQTMQLLAEKRYREFDQIMRLKANLMLGITVAFATYGLHVILHAVTFE